MTRVSTANFAIPSVTPKTTPVAAERATQNVSASAQQPTENKSENGLASITSQTVTASSQESEQSAHAHPFQPNDIRGGWTDQIPR